MSSNMKAKSTIKPSLLATNHSQFLWCEVKSDYSEVILDRNRKFNLG